MFGLFKKSTQIHEDVSVQRQEVRKIYSAAMAQGILDGEDCDQIASGFGPFGGKTNPIPVNGSLGEIKYLAKLCTKAGSRLFFHRLGSLQSSETTSSVDCYEVVGLDGQQWSKLYFDMYHPRRSNLAPANFELFPLQKELSADLPFGFGVNSRVENFPHGLPDAIGQSYGRNEIGPVLKRKSLEHLAAAKFIRPADFDFTI